MNDAFSTNGRYKQPGGKTEWLVFIVRPVAERRDPHHGPCHDVRETISLGHRFQFPELRK